MKILVQRVTHASIDVEGKTIASIGPGALVFVGVTHSDTAQQAIWLAGKLTTLRMFEDAQGKMNRSLLDCNGEVLIVSQFTLYGDCADGRRPSFTAAAAPELAKALYERLTEEVRKAGLKVQTGQFAAYMQVALLNDGPVTFMLESLAKNVSPST